MATSSRLHYPLPLPCSLLQLRPIAAKSSRSRSNLASPPLTLSRVLRQLRSCVNLLYFISRYFILYFPSVTCSQFVMQFYWLRTCFNLSWIPIPTPIPIPDSDSNQPRPRVNCRNGAHEKHNGNLVNLERDEREQQVGYALLLQPPFPPLFATSSLPPWRAGTDFN